MSAFIGGSLNETRTSNPDATSMIDRSKKSLVEAGKRLLSLRIGGELDAEAPFLVRFDDTGETWCGLVSGRGGVPSWVSFARGDRALDDMLAFLEEDQSLDEVDLLALTLIRWDELAELQRSFLTEAGVRARREKAVPSFAVRRPGRRLRAPNKSETKRWRIALEAVGTMLESGRLRPLHVDYGVPTLQRVSVGPSGKLDHITLDEVELQPLAHEPRLSVLLPEEPPTHLLSETWVVGFVDLDIDLGASASETYGFVVAVETQDDARVLDTQLTRGKPLPEALSGLLDLINGDHEKSRGLPERIKLAGRHLERALGQELRALGIQVETAPLPVDLTEILRESASGVNELLHTDEMEAQPEVGGRSAQEFDLEVIMEQIMGVLIAQLDVRIPALGNFTPRELCATAEGRNRVRDWIAEQDSVSGIDGSIEIDTERIFEELGMDAQREACED